MKIHVCIIEDEEQYSSLLKEMLRKWQDENSAVLSISLFSSGKDFLAGKETGFDLIFLDIQLGGCSGIEIARRMRVQGYEGEIVFLTAYQEYVFEGYNVRALNYFLKPIRYEQLDSCMQYVTRRLSASCFICRHYGDMDQGPVQGHSVFHEQQPVYGDPYCRQCIPAGGAPQTGGCPPPGTVYPVPPHRLRQHRPRGEAGRKHRLS